MKKILCIAIGMALLTCNMHAQAYVCSGSSHNADTTFVVLCAEDYNVNTMGGLPSVIFVDLQAVSTYSISGHVELSLIDTPDYIRIREVNADMSTIRYIGSYYNGTQDIQLYTESCRYLAIDVYCYAGAVSSTSGFSFTIRPTVHDEFEQVLISDKLGIGTTPTASLDVVGDLKLHNENVSVTVSPDIHSIDFQTTAQCYKFDKPIRPIRGLYSSPIDTNLTLQTYNTSRLTILNNNGYVGIGTTEPQEMLHVKGYVRGNGGHGCLTISTECGTTTIGCDSWAYSHFYTNRNAFYFDKGIVIRDGELSGGTAYDLFLKTYSTVDNAFHKRMTILRNSGNVGIGTENPQYKLDVAGEIHADSIRSAVIKSGAVFVESVYGADYVFEDNYNLRPLQDVSSYIQENGHLPEIQSAEDMLQNGVNMSEFQIKLLQKIEELTLYIIQQEERIKQLENQ